MQTRFPEEAGCSDAPADRLNAGCLCTSHEAGELADVLDAAGSAEAASLVAARCPHLFSAQPVFVSRAHLAMAEELITAIGSVVALPAWRDAVLRDAPQIARHDPGARGVFFGYDFHVGETGIALIEINTNAGGALLNAALARAQQPCPPLAASAPGVAEAEAFERAVIAMFREEFRLGGHGGPLRCVAIVDSDPEGQYLYPEFLLFQNLLRRHGIDAVIADPAALHWAAGALWHGDSAIDLVYNRLTDFMLEAPSSAALRAAYLEGGTVITPHPRAHALYADKRNLVILSDPARLEALGVPAATRAILAAGIPRTELVTPANAERLWQSRRQQFFKPAAGYGSRAAWRGDKLTKRVWEEILQGGYVAQALVAPPQRTVALADGSSSLKFDLRSYCYNDKVQWTAARVYQGQTTNMRTPGGGFAAVYPAA